MCSLTLYVVLLQEKRLLDLPKLLDICAIYGHENEDLTGFLVSKIRNGRIFILGSVKDCRPAFCIPFLKKSQSLEDFLRKATQDQTFKYCTHVCICFTHAL